MPIVAFQTPARSTSAPENGVPIRLITPTADARVCSGTTSNADTKKFAKKMPQVFHVQVHVGLRTEIQVAQPGTLRNMMRPGNHVNLLIAASAIGVAVFLHSIPQPEHGGNVGVVPRRLLASRDVDLLEPLGGVYLPPIVFVDRSLNTPFRSKQVLPDHAPWNFHVRVFALLQVIRISPAPRSSKRYFRLPNYFRSRSP